jgi:hypothetical protein
MIYNVYYIYTYIYTGKLAHIMQLVFLLEKTIRSIGEQNENVCSRCTIADFEQ